MTTEELTIEVLELKKAVAELQRRVFPPPVVYLLHHAKDLDEEVDVKLLGVFSGVEKAEQAREAVRDQPGFRDFPLGFHIDGYTVDKCHWTEGFVTV